jgi:hypothetical protein
MTEFLGFGHLDFGNWNLLRPHLKTLSCGGGWRMRLLKVEKINQMLKRVQHDLMVRFWSFCHPELVSGSRFWVLQFRF